MRRGPKPRPKAAPALKAGGLPRCPDHLDHVARKEWRRLASPLFEAGILTVADRAAFAAYCHSYSQWVEAVRKQSETPKLLKTPSGYVQQSPWIGIANKQLELMGRYMAELGLTPTSRTRLADILDPSAEEEPLVFKVIFEGSDGTCRDALGNIVEDRPDAIELDERL
ncbi:phage terminase, small subunit, putative, P27 family [Palleronia marisminoris]|uniref:Phage terminase, small subunit n=1 Tax=Palleronia marisminoris TaxID=315423 RepID=A0A1Y5RYI5_9RHOB|nr:phage terminase small subunit P27 family [Palleronia marisminoris]SFG40961.1 phage terminase, small subunit, putative, P27 family [Palleronia marisminoris]SLN28507.1 Phage terminase, small subunit [Palleronia marisminoris]